MATYYIRQDDRGFLSRPEPFKAKDLNDVRKRIYPRVKFTRKAVFVYTKPEATNSCISGVVEVFGKNGNPQWDVKGNGASILDIDPKTGKVVKADTSLYYTIEVLSSRDFYTNRVVHHSEMNLFKNISDARKSVYNRFLKDDKNREAFIVEPRYRRSSGHLYHANGKLIWDDKNGKRAVDPKTGRLM